MDLYILNAAGEPEKIEDADAAEWARWMRTTDGSVIVTEVNSGLLISTAFIGIDLDDGRGPPLLWETATFRGDRYLVSVRTGSRQEALAEHEKTVNSLQGGS